MVAAMNEQTYALIRLIFERAPGQPIDLHKIKAIGPIAMKDWAVLQVELVKLNKTTVFRPPRYTDLFL